MSLLFCSLKKLLLLLKIRYLYLELKFRAIGDGIQQFEQIYFGHLTSERLSCSIEQKKLANVHGQISFAQRTLNHHIALHILVLNWYQEKALPAFGG